MMSLGDAVKLARRAQNLTQKDLADRLGLSRNYIAQIEMDRKTPTFSTLTRIAVALDTTPGALSIDDGTIRTLREKLSLMDGEILLRDLRDLETSLRDASTQK